MKSIIQFIIDELAELVRDEGMTMAMFLLTISLVIGLPVLFVILMLIIVSYKFTVPIAFLIGLIYCGLKYAVEKESK